MRKASGKSGSQDTSVDGTLLSRTPILGHEEYWLEKVFGIGQE